jgi:hypothetical protein
MHAEDKEIRAAADLRLSLDRRQPAAELPSMDDREKDVAFNGRTQKNSRMASGSPEHHMDRVGRRLDCRSFNPVLAA